MYTRYAIFEGTVHRGREDDFFRLVEERLLPLWRQMPHAQAVRVVRGVETDAGVPPAAMILAIDYPSREAIAEALASPVRARARAVTEEILELLDGRFYHVIGRRLGPA
jgi:hypothetical protein